MITRETKSFATCIVYANYQKTASRYKSEKKDHNIIIIHCVNEIRKESDLLKTVK